MNDKNSPEIEVSAISGRFARIGTAVDVRIYRAKSLGEDGFWTFEIVSEEGKSRICGNTFPTDQTPSKHSIARLKKMELPLSSRMA